MPVPYSAVAPGAMGIRPPEDNYLGFLNRYNRDYETTTDYENIHELYFDPLSTIGDTEDLRYNQFYKALSDINFNFTGNRISIPNLPVVSEKLDLLDPKSKEEYKGYYAWREAVQEVAEDSHYFKYNLPPRNQKDFVDRFTNEVYGVYRTALNMLPPEGTREREQVMAGFDVALERNWNGAMVPMIKSSADEYGIGWEGETGEYMKQGFQNVKEGIGLEMQKDSGALGYAKLIGGMVAPLMPPFTPAKAGMEIYQNIELIRTKGFKEAAAELGEGIFESGVKIEMEAEDAIKVLKGPSGKYLESVGDISFDFEGALNPYYVGMKIGLNLPQQLLTTGVAIGGGAAASAMVGTGVAPLVALGAYTVGQLPGLSINYALEAGDMYGSSRDYLRELRSKALDAKGKGSKKDFANKYNVFVTEHLEKTADKLEDNEIHEIASTIAGLYGVLSTAIEGVTNVGALAGWMKSFTGVTSTAMKSKSGKNIISRKLTEKLGPFIMKHGKGSVSKLWGLSREPMQEALQEGTGEWLRAKALPGYRYDPNVKLDAAYSGFWFGGGQQIVGKAIDYKRKKKAGTPSNLGDLDVLTQDAIAAGQGLGKDKNVENIVKTGLILTTDFDFINDLTSDRAERRELKLLAQSYISEIGKPGGWGDPANAANMIAGNKDAVANLFPADYNEQGLKNNNFINFTDQQVADMLGKPIIAGAITEIPTIDADPNVNLTDEYVDPSFDNIEPNIVEDTSESMLGLELQETQSEVNRITSQGLQHGESQADFDARLKPYQDDLNMLTNKYNELHKKNRPDPSGDPKAHMKQMVIDKLNQIPAEFFNDTERSLIKSMMRSNAAQSHIDAADGLANLKIEEYNESLKPVEKGKSRWEEKLEALGEIKEEAPVGVTKIISGGQIGADLAGLEVGKELGIETGGTAPPAFMTSEGQQKELLEGYGLTEGEADVKIWPKRTKKNVDDSDGTVLFGDADSPGSALTIGYAKKVGKPLIHNPTHIGLRRWIDKNNINTLNIAGNRNIDTGPMKDLLSKVLGQDASPEVKTEQMIDDLESARTLDMKPKEYARKYNQLKSTTNEKLLTPSEYREVLEEWEDLEIDMSDAEFEVQAIKDMISIEKERTGKDITVEEAKVKLDKIVQHYTALEGEIATEEIETEVSPSEVEDVHDIAEAANFDIESDEFRSLSRAVTGKEHIDDMTLEERVKLIERIGALKLNNVMNNFDIGNIVSNILKNVIPETVSDTPFSAKDLSALSNEQLVELAIKKGVPDVNRFITGAQQEIFEEFPRNDIIEAILDAQGPIELQMGIGMFPMFKKSTKNRIFRWFDQAWSQSRDRYELNDREFNWWAKSIEGRMPIKLRPYWREWSETIPLERSLFDKLTDVVIGDEVSGYTQADMDAMGGAVDFGEEYVNQNIKGTETGEVNLEKGVISSTSGDVSFREGFNRVNATAFQPLGIYVDNDEAKYITKEVNNSVSFDDWLTKISNNVPLPDGRTIWEMTRIDKSFRNKLKQFYESNSEHNTIRVNRNVKAENSRTNFEFLHRQPFDGPGVFVVSRLKGEGSFIVGKTNPKWARKMHGENYLGDVELIWINGSDINTARNVKGLAGEQLFQPDGEYQRVIGSRYKFLNSVELWELTDGFFQEQGVVPLFPRGEEDMLATVKISKMHYDFARLGSEYWISEDLPQIMREEFSDIYGGNTVSDALESFLVEEQARGDVGVSTSYYGPIPFDVDLKDVQKAYWDGSHLITKLDKDMDLLEHSEHAARTHLGEFAELDANKVYNDKLHEWRNLEDESVKIDFMAGDNKVVFTFLHPEEVYSKADVFDRVHGAVEAVQKKLRLAYNTDIVVKSNVSFERPLNTVEDVLGGPTDYLSVANIARHESMKQILGPKYYTVPVAEMMKRLKAFFTPGISVAGGPKSKVYVFDAKDVVFETTYPKDLGGGVTEVDALINIDNKDQYRGDGQTITSEKKFRDTYPNLLGTDERAKRAKTIIGGHNEDGVFIGKHQEMTMYVPLTAVMKVKRGDEVLAEIYSNGETTDIYVDGQYVDHLMTKDEAKVRLGDNFNRTGEVIELDSEATTHIQAVGSPKNTSNFPMQLMNYITDPRLLDAVNNMILEQEHGSSTRNFYKYLFKVARDPAALDEMIINLGDSMKDAPPQYAVENAKLGTGLHPANAGIASTLAQTKIVKRAMSVLQKGSSLDFRADYLGSVGMKETMLPGNVPAIRDQIYERYADAHEISYNDARKNNISVINKWLRGNNVRVLITRFPIPSSYGYGVYRVKGLLGALAGDSFVVHPKVVKGPFEADHDHDTGHVAFLDDNIMDLLEDNQEFTEGIDLAQYIPEDHATKYSFSNLHDTYKLFEELSFGKQAIAEINNVTRAAGVISNHFEHMVLDGKRVISTPLKAEVHDANSGITDTLENIYRIYAQAAFDNAEFRLLKGWQYSQDNLFKLLFKNDDGTELSDRQYKTLGIYINTIKLNGHIANGKQQDSQYSLSDTFRQSEDYRRFVQNREDYVRKKIVAVFNNISTIKENYALPGEVKMNLDAVHPHEMLSMMPDIMAEREGIDPSTLFNNDVETAKIMHHDAVSKVYENRMDNIVEVSSDMGVTQMKREIRDGNIWAQSMIDELDELTYSMQSNTEFGIQKILNQTWDYNENFVAFAHRWHNGVSDPKATVVGFKELSPVAQKAATYEFLRGLNRRDWQTGTRHNTYNVMMFPPVSGETLTLLDPDVMREYNKEYNALAKDKYEDMTRMRTEEYTSLPSTIAALKEHFGCE